MATGGSSAELQEKKREVYCAPLDEFVRRRDALAKSCRAAGQREVADSIKAWRKPARLAWALNNGVVSFPRVAGDLVDSVARAAEAHSTGGDVRHGMTQLRAAVRNLAEAASMTAARSGHPVDAATLSSAIFAVLGSSDAFAQLQAGYLADIPEGGGLDALANLSIAAGSATSRAESTSPPEKAGPDPRDALRLAAETVSRLRAASDAATQAAQVIRADVAEAEQRVREAERELRAVRQRHEEAKRRADAAAAELEAAKSSHADALANANGRASRR